MMADTTASKTNDDAADQTKKGLVLMPSKQNPYDFLSFMSLFVVNTTELTTSLFLVRLVLDRLAYEMQNPVGRGSLFSVNIVKTSLLRERLHYNLPSDFLGPRELVALKRPMVRGELSSLRNQQILTAMALEYQVLRSDSLQSHPNIIQLLGVSWQSVDVKEDLILPVLVLEAAEYGSLASLLNSGNAVTLNEELLIALDIATGLAALHEHGIIHGDVKPQNVLIFKTADRKYVAKLADFGSSIFLENVIEKVRLSQGTALWRAPECSGLIEPNMLYKTDIFSFRFLLIDLLTAQKVSKFFLEESHSTLAEDFKNHDALRAAAWEALKDHSRDAVHKDQADGGPGDLDRLNQESNDSSRASSTDDNTYMASVRHAREEIGYICFNLLAKDPKDRTKSMSDIVQDLRWVLHKLFRNELINSLDTTSEGASDTWGVDEHDVLMCPGRSPKVN
jgi:serine/threonine protein kinase